MIALLLAPTAQLVDPSAMSDINLPRVIFWIFALFTILGAISTLMRKNDIAAVMSLVFTFFMLAGVYTFLSAHFIAVLQVLVYAGAIMVLFIFVVMVLNRDESEPWVWRGLAGKALFGVLPLLPLCYFLCTYLRDMPTKHPDAPDAAFGTVAQVGQLLFTDYLFSFEVVSVLLIIAVIAAVVVARSAKSNERDHQPADGAAPLPGHRFGEPQTGTSYASNAVPTPPGSGGGPSPGHGPALQAQGRPGPH
ncbi:MAG: NADH-quinone oxidoreductase subunit J [Polyangia bacterium]